MARLDGKKSSPGPYIVGLLLLLLIAVAVYWLSNRNKTSGLTPPPQSRVTSAAGSGTVGSMGNATTGPTSQATGSNPVVSTTPSTPSSLNANPASESPASTNKGRKDVIMKRSKTLTNVKNGTSVTYSKEVHRDGSVIRSKTAEVPPKKP